MVKNRAWTCCEHSIWLKHLQRRDKRFKEWVFHHRWQQLIRSSSKLRQKLQSLPEAKFALLPVLLPITSFSASLFTMSPITIPTTEANLRLYHTLEASRQPYPFAEDNHNGFMGCAPTIPAFHNGMIVNEWQETHESPTSVVGDVHFGDTTTMMVQVGDNSIGCTHERFNIVQQVFHTTRDGVPKVIQKLQGMYPRCTQVANGDVFWVQSHDKLFHYLVETYPPRRETTKNEYTCAVVGCDKKYQSVKYPYCARHGTVILNIT